MKTLVLSALLALPAAAAETHTHAAPERPAPGETCSCATSAVTSEGDCIVEDSKGACLLKARASEECSRWECPGAAQTAHAASTPVAVRDGKPCASAKVVLPALPAAPKLPESLSECSLWEERSTVSYSATAPDGATDCSAPRISRSLRCKARLCGSTATISESKPPQGRLCECAYKDVTYHWVSRSGPGGTTRNLEASTHCLSWHCHEK